jgi:hypothetical protein
MELYVIETVMLCMIESASPQHAKNMMSASRIAPEPEKLLKAKTHKRLFDPPNVRTY